jgi:hypothetical protein
MDCYAPFKYDEKTDIALQLKSLSGSTFGSIFVEGILIDETGTGLRE